MAANEVYMDPAQVRSISKGLAQISQVVKAVSAVLEIQMMILKTTAFMGVFGGFAAQAFLEKIKPEVDRFAAKLQELSEDVEQSVQKWEAAQQR